MLLKQENKLVKLWSQGPIKIDLHNTQSTQQ